MKSCIVLLGFLTISAVPNAMALSVTLEQGPYSSGIGGEFVAAAPASDPGLANYDQYYSSLTLYTGSPAGASPGLYGFATFCMEYTEEFTPGDTYPVTLGPNAMYGGMPPNGNPLRVGTAYLYYLFATGNQTFGYNWNPANRAASAGQLQNAIWWLENEGPGNVPLAYDPNNIFENLVISQFGSASNAMADNNSLYPVEVMVLGQPGQYQDQLILTSDSVPDGGTTLLLLGAACGGIALFKRRFV